MKPDFHISRVSRVRATRFLLVAVAILGVALPPALPAAADDPVVQPGTSSALFHVDTPTPYAVLTNGTAVAISGWTAGSRVDLYLDGPAGVGTGIGSAAITVGRPDVRSSLGTDRVYKGFAASYLPTMLPGGAHTLYAYSLIDGAWVLETVPIIGAGNVLPPDRMNDGSGDMM